MNKKTKKGAFKGIVPEGKNNRFNANVATPNDNLVLLGLDISSYVSGYCFMNGSGKLINYGVIKCEGIVPERLRQLKDALSGLLNKYQPTFCAIEDMIAFKFGGVAKLLNYFNGVAILACYEFNGNEVELIASSAMKKSIEVNPRALKKEGYDRAGIKEIVYNKICDLYKIKISESDPDYKYRHDVSDGILCAHKLLKNLKGG